MPKVLQNRKYYLKGIFPSRLKVCGLCNYQPAYYGGYDHHARYGVIKLSIAFCRSLYKPLVNEVEIQNYTLCCGKPRGARPTTVGPGLQDA